MNRPIALYFGRRRVSGICFLLAVLLSSLPAASDPQSLAIGAFSGADAGGALPADWEPLVFDEIERHTAYELVEKGRETVVRAVSRASASGLIRRIRVDPARYRLLQWRWQAAAVYEKGNVTEKSGDDYPARIYVAFAYDPETAGLLEKARFNAYKLIYGEYPPARAINYIWASHAEPGTRVRNAYTRRVEMIVVESGRARLNTWVEEERNVYRDYMKAFGERPPEITGIAIMTDSDNTEESATAYYGDIILKQESAGRK